MRLLIRGETLLPETGASEVGDPFFAWMEWTDLLEHENVLTQHHKEGNHLDTKSLISHIENFIVMGKNVMVPNARGELITTLAARLGNIDVIKICLKAGLDMNMADSCGYTPLFLAVAMGKVEMVELLLSYDYPCNLCRANKRALVDPNKVIAGGAKLPPIIGATLAPRKAHKLIDHLCGRGVKITTTHKFGNLLHYAFDISIGKWSITEDDRQNMLSTALDWAAKQNCKQEFLDARMPNYSDQEYNYEFPVSVLDRIALDGHSSEDYKPLIDLLLREGATVFPSVASVLLEEGNFDTFEYIFTNELLTDSKDPVDILTEPWHGGVFYARYTGEAGDVEENESAELGDDDHAENSHSGDNSNGDDSQEFEALDAQNDGERIEIITGAVDSQNETVGEKTDAVDLQQEEEEADLSDIYLDIFGEDGSNIIGRCRFCMSLEYPDERAYSCELFKWNDGTLDDMPSGLWINQVLKSVYLPSTDLEVYPPSSEVLEEDLVNKPYRDVKKKIEEFPRGVPFRIRTTTDNGFQRKLLRMCTEGDDPGKFLDFTRALLQARPKHERAKHFLQRLNELNPITTESPISPSTDLEEFNEPESEKLGSTKPVVIIHSNSTGAKSQSKKLEEKRRDPEASQASLMATEA